MHCLLFTMHCSLYTLYREKPTPPLPTQNTLSTLRTGTLNHERGVRQTAATPGDMVVLHHTYEHSFKARATSPTATSDRLYHVYLDLILPFLYCVRGVSLSAFGIGRFKT